MNKRSLGALIALNIALLVGLLAAVLSPQQASGQNFVKAQYLMIAGNIQARDQQAMVYIIEMNSGRMAAVLFNSANKNLDVVDGRILANDLAASAKTR